MSTAPVLNASTLRNIKSQGFLDGIALLIASTQGDATGASMLSWGTGAPNHTAAQGSVYIRLDAADSDTVFYRNTDGAATYEAIVGSEITDLLAANNAFTGNNTHSGTETFSNAAGVSTDVVSERSAGVGVTIDGAKVLDGHLVDSVGFYDAAAPTKVVRLDAGAVTAGQTRVLAMPDADVTMGAYAPTLLNVADEATFKAAINAEVGVDVQAYDASLTSLALLATGADKIPYATGVDTYAEATLTAFARSILDDADEATFKATVNLEIGTDVQAYDATLTSIAALGTAADKIAYTTGIDTWAESAITAFGRSILDDADEATFKATVNLESGVDVQAYSATLAGLATEGLDRSAVAVVACADASGGATTALLSVQLNQVGGGAIGAARQCLLQINSTQYMDGSGPADVSLTLGTVTAGSIVATITVGSLYLIETDAAGLFACTATNTDDTTSYFSAKTSEAGVADVAKRVQIVGSNSDSATWSA